MSERENRFLDEWAEPLIFCGLALVCLVIYGQTVRFDFINLDDHSYVYLNERVLNGLRADTFKWAFTAFHSSNWHPLTWLSHALDVQLFGLNPGAHHAVNVILHLANACLAFVVFREYTGALWKSALVAFLFAVHPAHVESVAWISERKDVLSTLFWLLTMLAYVRYAKSESSERSILTRFVSPGFLLTFLLFAFGLLAKPMLVTLPIVLLLLDIWPLKRAANARAFVPLIVEKIPLFGLIVASSILAFLAQRAGGSVLGIGRFPIESRIGNAIFSYVKYVILMFFPVNLGVWYPFDPYVGTVELVASAAGLLAVTGLAIWQLGKRPYIAVGWFWFLGTLIPVIGLVQVGAQSMADRYTYIPYFGLLIILVWGAAELIDKFEIDLRVATGIWAAAIVALAVVAFHQAGYWKNSETLYTRTIAVTKENFFLMNLLCRHYIDKTPVENAERRCTELLDNTSNYLEAHNTIGLLRVELGRYDDALVAYKKALQIEPNTGIVYSNMAVAFAKKRDTVEAEKHLRRAIELRDGSVSPGALAYSFNILGEAYAVKNESSKARESFGSALRNDPSYEPAKQNLAKLQGAK